jgi:hypothetical protein
MDFTCLTWIINLGLVKHHVAPIHGVPNTCYLFMEMAHTNIGVEHTKTTRWKHSQQMWDEGRLRQINQKVMAQIGERMEEFFKIRTIFN